MLASFTAGPVLFGLLVGLGGFRVAFCAAALVALAALGPLRALAARRR
jgi:hypothetical protein